MHGDEVGAAFEEGLLAFSAGANPAKIRMLLPVNTTDEELEELGLIGREPDPTDRRSSILFPTPFGLERLAEARAPQESTLLHALEEWSIDDIRTLTRLLHALTARERP